MDQSEFEANTRIRRQTRIKACERGTIGFGFVFHWLRKWREFWKPITERSKAKAKQTRNSFRHSIKNRSSVVKPNIDVNKKETLNESELEENVSNRHQAEGRENACEQVVHDWLCFCLSLVEKVG